MKHNLYKNSSLGLVLALTLSACTDVIEIDLNSSNPKFVIEGKITNRVGDCEVKITKTTDFFNPDFPPPVHDAEVFIYDNLGDTLALLETFPGVYTHATGTAVTGRTYILSIKAEGESFSAQSVMPALVPLDSISQQLAIRQTPGKDPNYNLMAHFKDPEGTGNRYRMRVFKGPLLEDNNPVQSDENLIKDGSAVTLPMRGVNYKTGELARLELWCVDPVLYQYFSTLGNSSQAPGQGISAAPGNPISNLSDGALGYFGAVQITAKSLEIR